MPEVGVSGTTSERLVRPLTSQSIGREGRAPLELGGVGKDDAKNLPPAAEGPWETEQKGGQQR